MSIQMQVKNKRFQELISKYRYLREYVERFVGTGYSVPAFYEKLEDSLKFVKKPNVLYPISEQVFIHVYAMQESADGYTVYGVIEPPEPHPLLMQAINKIFAIHAGSISPPNEYQEKFLILDEFLANTCVKVNGDVDYSKALLKNNKVLVNAEEFEYLKYHFIRRRIGLSLLEPFLTDPYLEDITIMGNGNVYVVHKLFGPLKSSVWLSNDDVEELMINMAEQVGKTISHARPVVDATLPEGSRINIVFGKDISRRGTNATVRRFASVPLSITQIVASNTLDAREAAYLWMMINEGMSIFICGETASGKTTTLMASCAFISPTWKVVSIEDTPEITLPHANWTSEVTRDTGNPQSSVTMFDLLKAALRQRPNYILVGEIRGAEGNIAFQAMQTGHPVISTFHAATVASLIQRLTNEPINVPKTHIDNLNIALFQSAVQGKQGKLVRRVLSINEIIGYNPATDSIMFIPVFNWDPGEDIALYRGKGSSALFATKLLVRRGLSKKDESLLYDELEMRASIIRHWISNKIFNYHDVYNHIVKVKEMGLQAYMEKMGVKYETAK
ncbi:MAG: type II/IV secretion system ATPase subunit [Candidatus Nitrosocaldus sp.]